MIKGLKLVFKNGMEKFVWNTSNTLNEEKDIVEKFLSIYKIMKKGNNATACIQTSDSVVLFFLSDIAYIELVKEEQKKKRGRKPKNKKTISKTEESISNNNILKIDNLDTESELSDEYLSVILSGDEQKKTNNNLDINIDNISAADIKGESVEIIDEPIVDNKILEDSIISVDSKDTNKKKIKPIKKKNKELDIKFNEIAVSKETNINKGPVDIGISNTGFKFLDEVEK